MRAIDPKIAPQVGFIGPYLQLGEVDLVFSILDEDCARTPILGSTGISAMPGLRKAGVSAPQALRGAGGSLGMVDYWKQYGYPDGCRA